MLLWYARAFQFRYSRSAKLGMHKYGLIPVLELRDLHTNHTIRNRLGKLRPHSRLYILADPQSTGGVSSGELEARLAKHTTHFSSINRLGQFTTIRAVETVFKLPAIILLVHGLLRVRKR